MFSSPALALAVASIAVVSVFSLLEARRRGKVRGHRLPPGPLPLPFVGNILSIDLKKPWVTYQKWAAQYGDTIMIRVLKQDIVVINTEKVAKDLLDRRSRIYSDRPYFATREPCGWSFNFAFEPYGDRWRSQRRIFHETFRAEAAATFLPLQLREARQLTLNILNAPQDYSSYFGRYSTAVVFPVVYGNEARPAHNELLHMAAPPAMESLTPEVASIIEAFPFLLKLPKWFPRAVFRRKAETCKRYSMQLIVEPFERARESKGAGGRNGSAMAFHRPESKSNDDTSQLELLKDTCATAFLGGSGTVSAALNCFMLAMLQHPEAQERAQAEIDMVIGTDRLPNFDDRPSLPYIEAVLLETFRMYPIVPLGVAHATTTDDIYDGFFIPKGNGCTVVPNVWAMHHNEDVYPEPHHFRPERFFVDGKLCADKLVNNLVFGFGRRVCPGRHGADSSVWIAVVSILSAFKISKVINDRGEELDFEPTWSSGLLCAPDPFPCTIALRMMNTDIRAMLSMGDV